MFNNVLKVARKQIEDESPHALEVINATEARLGKPVADAAVIYYLLVIAIMQFDDTQHMARETAFIAGSALAAMLGVPGGTAIALSRAFHADNMNGVA